MAKRFRSLCSVVLYGVLVTLTTSTAAMAEHHQRHRATNERKHQQIAEARHDRLVTKHHQSRRERLAETHARREHRAKIAKRPLTRGERLHLIRLVRAMKKTRELEQIAYNEMHLHRVRLDAIIARQERIAAAAAYKLHMKHVVINRAECLAEMNGDLASKSIRAFQEYVINVPIRMITVDLNDPTVKVSALLAHNGIGTAEPFSGMIRRSQPDVAVTGTFFSLDNLRPVGDIVINGDLAYFGGMGTALCITRDNRADMITVPWGHHHDWSSYDFVMACGPRLLQDHEIVLDPQSERFHDQHMLAPNSRIGVGITATNKLVFVMTKEPIYLGRLAKIMRDLGCSQAMNLDAGTSTGFYYEGNMMASPGRWLTNAIVIYANQHPAVASAS